MTRKRTARIDLAATRKSGAAGSAGVATLVLGSIGLQGCSESTLPANAYANAAECRLYRGGCDEVCQTAFDQASRDAAVNGPHYSTQYDCAYDFGTYSCVRDQRGGYGPAMRGYLLPADDDCSTSAVRGGTGGGAGPHGPRKPRALYSPASTSAPGYGRWFTSDGRDMGALSQTRMDVPQSVFADHHAGSGRTLSRGGFGQTVRTHSSTGSHFRLGS